MIYTHTQTGWFMLISFAIAIILLYLIYKVRKLKWIKKSNIVLWLVGVIVVVIWMFTYSLTVNVSEDNLSFWFWPWILKKEISLDKIQSCKVVKNKWYTGWGIRYGRGFVLYNVSGWKAAELELEAKDMKLRIGSDEPEKICEVLDK